MRAASPDQRHNVAPEVFCPRRHICHRHSPLVSGGLPCALRPIALVPLAVIAAALAGCGGGSGTSSGSGSSSGGSTASGPASPASAAAPASSAPAADAASITPERLCALVPVKEAAAAARTSPAITEQESGSFVHHEPECGYASADQKLIINVTIFNPAQTKVDLTHGVMSDAALTPVSGLGKSAAAGGPEVDVLFGDRALVVESFGSTAASLDQLQALAKVELSRLS
jgi:hypothetical protein